MFSKGTGFRAQMAKQFIYLMIVIIIAVAVVMPVVQDVIDEQAFNGTVGTLMDLVPLFIALAIILLIVNIMY